MPSEPVVTIEFCTVEGERMMARISMSEATRLALALKDIFVEYLGDDAPGEDDAEGK